MKFIILLAIRLYWNFIPASKRRSCIFRESCSKYVYRIAKEKGFLGGLNAFAKRYKQCRPGYQITSSSLSEETVMILCDGSVIENTEIADHLIN